jgi:hypothetical protein
VRRGDVLAALAVLPLLLGAAAAPGSSGQVAFSFRDARIAESSGLVALGSGLFVTTNDSGDLGRVFTVDSRGRTVGVTTWSRDAVDVEALAPAGAGEVWVGDIGDNRASRDSVQVTRVPVGRGDRTSDGPVYELVYPDGAHDAETLLAGPDGRLYVVTKGFLGGTVYAAPAGLDAARPNRLEQVGPPAGVLAMATDGAFLPDGREVLVRGYAGAILYDFPTFDRVRAVPLPAQRQGEGLAFGPDGTIYLSSEGVRAAVLRLPALEDAAPATPAASTPATPATPSGAATEPAAPSGRPGDHDSPDAPVDRTHRPWWPWLLGGAVGLAIVGVTVRSLRPR